MNRGQNACLPARFLARSQCRFSYSSLVKLWASEAISWAVGQWGSVAKCCKHTGWWMKQMDADGAKSVFNSWSISAKMCQVSCCSTSKEIVLLLRAGRQTVAGGESRPQLPAEARPGTVGIRFQTFSDHPMLLGPLVWRKQRFIV